jgi:intein/homing endonuclease
MISPSHQFTATSNQVPMASTIKGARLFIASKYASISGDSEILVQRSDGSIFYGPIENYEWASGDMGESIDKKTNHAVWAPIRTCLKHKFKGRMFDVLLKSGRSIRATDSHSFVTMGGDGNLVERFSEDLKVGDPIPRSRRIMPPSPSGVTSLFIPRGAKHNAREERDFILNADLGWIVGMFLAEGCITKRKDRKGDLTQRVFVGINLAAADKQVREEIKDILDRNSIPFNESWNVGLGDFSGITINWKALATVFGREFGHGAAGKRLPGWVFGSPLEFRQGIVGGYLCGDGTVGKGDAVSFGSRSRLLRDGICLLLSGLGVDTSISSHSVIGRPFYEGRAFKEDCQSLPALRHQKKDSLLKNGAKWSGKRSADWIPINDPIRETMLKHSIRGGIERGWIYQNQITTPKLKKTFGDRAKDVCSWVDSGVRWDRIKKLTEINEVDEWVYDLDLGDNVFSANLGVFIHNTQAIPPVNPEAPLVEPLNDETNEGFSTTFGKKLGQRFSPVAGTVKRVHEDFIDIVGDDGSNNRMELRRFFPRNKKTYLSEIPMVNVGDRVNAGAAVARNNYTDKEGRFAPGKNLAVAFMPAPGGATFEDAIAVSQTAANRMTSSHMYGFDVEHKNGVESGKQRYISLFPNKYTNDQLAKIGPNGMLLPGATVDEGDPVMLSMSPRSLSSKDAALGNLSKVLRNSYQDLSQVWDHSTQGRAAHALEHRNGLTLKLTTNMPLQEGDKISALQGAKGVVSKIIPDEQMVHDKDGNPMDILINPAALIGRVNPGMIYEALLGKIAHKHNKRYALPSFSEDSFRDYTEHELNAHGETDREDLMDPMTGRVAPQVLTGRQMFLKLEHTSDGKLSGRGDGGIDQNDQPSKGGDEGGKRVGGLQMMALLSHGVPEVIKDAHLYRGSSNPDMWRKVRTGEPLPLPKSPFIYDKFINSLRGAGVNVKDDGRGRLRLMAMTDKDVDDLAPHELQNAETISYKDGSPIKGGLMDFALHGGPEGKGWSHVKLDEPLPNPMMEDPLRRLLGLTEKQMRGIIGGTETYNGGRGPQAIHDALAATNLDDLAAIDRNTIRTGKKTKRDDAVRRLNFITGLQNANLKPTDLMINKVPVLPPTYRPISKVGKLMLTADANYLYRDLMGARDSLRQNKTELPDEDLADERLSLYDSIKAVQGLGDPINPETAAKGVKGFVRQIAGVGGPKHGLFMSKVIGHPVNAVGRGVIVPDSDLNMDEVGIPKEMAWRMFEAQTMRSMVKAGMPATDADKRMEKRDSVALQHLIKTVDGSHVMYGRDPALHRFSIMGGKPRIVAGNNIRLSPLVVKPFGADFDGDQMNIHVPISDEAQREVRDTMLPSQNLFGLRHRQVHYLPSQEFIYGLASATGGSDKAQREKPIQFKTREEAIKAYQQKLIPIDQPIEITG